MMCQNALFFCPYKIPYNNTFITAILNGLLKFKLTFMTSFCTVYFYCYMNIEYVDRESRCLKGKKETLGNVYLLLFLDSWGRDGIVSHRSSTGTLFKSLEEQRYSYNNLMLFQQ